jgi:16S rRNA (guanine527-N7)-methyltransferase
MLFDEALRQTGFPEPEVRFLVEKMELYIRELQLFNTAYNLVNTDNRDEIIIRHILDSLAAAPYIRKLTESRIERGSAEPVVIGDIGSGGGLPGIPLAAAFPHFHFILVERMSKRCAFLENCSAILGLKNIQVANLEAEHVEHGLFDICVFRAFRPLDKTMIKTLTAMLKPDGILMAYKAKREKIQEEMKAITEYIHSYDIIPLTVPFLTDTANDSRERNLVIVQKTAVTDIR